MTIPIVTRDRAHELQQIKADHIDSWFQSMQEQNSQRFKTFVFRAKDLRAFCAPDMQAIGLFNQVIGLGPQNQELLAEIMHFYREQGVETYRIEVNPYTTSTDFLASLAEAGFFMSRFENCLFRTFADRIDENPGGAVLIREVAPSDIDLFADLHVQGYAEALTHLPAAVLRLYRESTKTLFQRQGWHLYLAMVDGIPSGMGMLYIHQDTAIFAGGATIPSQRGKGVQTALLQHRLRVAAQSHCRLIVGQTSVGSTSQHNMERLCMRLAYTGVGMTHRHS